MPTTTRPRTAPSTTLRIVALGVLLGAVVASAMIVGVARDTTTVAFASPGVATLVTVAVGVAAIVAARGRRTPRERRVAAAACAIAATIVIVAALLPTRGTR